MGLLAHPQAEFPARLVRTFVAAWSDETSGPALRSMLRVAQPGSAWRPSK
ncbi:MAG TPA: hypothetical protein VGH43_17010 [Jatrophihabitans sp.]|jgi:hypothetical protein